MVKNPSICFQVTIVTVKLEIAYSNFLSTTDLSKTHELEDSHVMFGGHEPAQLGSHIMFLG